MAIAPLEKGYARCLKCQQDVLIEELERNRKCTYCKFDYPHDRFSRAKWGFAR